MYTSFVVSTLFNKTGWGEGSAYSGGSTYSKEALIRRGHIRGGTHSSIKGILCLKMFPRISAACMVFQVQHWDYEYGLLQGTC